MNRLTVTQVDGHIIGTYDADGTILAVKVDATGDFLYDCANLTLKIEEKMKKAGR